MVVLLILGQFLVDFLSFFHAKVRFFERLGGLFEYIFSFMLNFSFCGAGFSF